MCQRQLIGAQGKAMRPKEQARMGYQIGVFRKRCAYHIPDRIQGDDTQKEQDDDVYDAKDPISRRFLYLMAFYILFTYFLLI